MGGVDPPSQVKALMRGNNQVAAYLIRAMAGEKSS